MILNRLKYIFLFSLSIQLGYGQEWVDMMRNPTMDFRKAQAAFNKKWENSEYQRGKGYKQFKRWENFIQPRMNKKGRYNPAATWDEFSWYQKQHRAEIAEVSARTTGWRQVGPFTPPGDYNENGIGRIDCIEFHPQDSSTYWVGAPSGGLWKTTNNGDFWTTSSDNWEGLGISDIVIDPNNPETMYVATGDRDHYAVLSYGVLKSTDGGETWRSSGLSTLSRIFKLLIDPDDSQVIFAATCCGIYRTTDGGDNWNLITSVPTHEIFDIEFKPDDNNVLYAVAYEAIFNHDTAEYFRTFGFYRSEDNGGKFEEIPLPFPTNAINRAEIGVSEAAPDNVYLYCSDAETSGFYGLYKSTEQGNDFVQIAAPNDPVIHPEEADLSLTIKEVLLYQGWYDWAMSINPKDINEIYLGAVGMIRTYDEGDSWEYVAGYNSGAGAIHFDFHAIEYHPITNRVFVGCDGGVWREPYQGLEWTPINDSLVTTQNYTLGSSFHGTSLLIGNQDNATYYYNGQDWDIVTGGDGMGCMIDPVNPNILYTSAQQGFIYKITDGQFEAILTPFITNQRSRWETVLRMDPVFRNEIYTLYEDVWKSDDGGANWRNISNGQIDVLYDVLEQLEIAESNTDYIYTADLFEVFRTTNGGEIWNQLNRPWGIFEGVGDLEVDPNNPNRLWVCTWGGRVFRTDDGGLTWVNLTGTLPNIKANNIIFQKGERDALYLAMDVGVFYRDNTMSDWMPFYTNLPNVVVTDLEIIYCEGILRAATYGRGVWETDLNNFNPSAVCCNSEVATLTQTGELLICGEPSYMVAASAAPEGSTYQWYKDGEAIPNATTSTYEASESGVYTIRFLSGSCSSFASDPLILTLLPNGVCTETCADLNPNTPDGPNNPTIINITESLHAPDPNEQIWICITTEGDLGTEVELMNIYDEDDTLLGQTVFGKDCSAPSPEACFYISPNDFERWTSDGQLTVTLDPINTEIGLFCEVNQACVGLRYSTPANINCEGDLEVALARNNTTYQAGNVLSSTAIIASNQTTTFTAGQYIDLLPDFDAAFGSDFDAYIEDCSDVASPAFITPSTNAFLDNGCDKILDTKEWYFEWTNIPNASDYHLLVYAPKQMTPVIDKKAITVNRYTSRNFDFIENDHTANWKALVRAKVGNEWTNWSAPISFNVESLNADCIKETVSRSSAITKSPFPQLNHELQLVIHPNPAKDFVNINYFINKVMAFDIQLYDITGQKVQQIRPLKPSDPGEHRIHLPTTELQAGIYYIVIDNKDFRMSEELIVVE